MKRRKPPTIVCIGTIMLLILACASPRAERTGALDRFDRVIDAVDDLADSYEKENLSTFMRSVGADYDLDYLSLERLVQDEFDGYDAFDISIIVDRVSTDSSGTIVFADTHWTKRRVSGSTGRQGKQTGRTTFIFRINTAGDLLLKGMKGDRLFGGQ